MHGDPALCCKRTVVACRLCSVLGFNEVVPSGSDETRRWAALWWFVAFDFALFSVSVY